MNKQINWYEKDTDEIYEYNGDLTDEESFQFINHLLQNYPDLDIEWIEMFEELKDYLFDEERITDVLNFVKLYQQTFPGEYEAKYQFIERNLITYFLYKGDIEALKERLEIIKTNPVHGFDLVTIRALYQLIYHKQFDIAIKYSKAVWKPLFESKDLVGDPHAEFCVSIYLHELEKLYQNIKNNEPVNVEKFRKEMEKYELYEDIETFEIVQKNLTEPLNKQVIQSKIENESKDLLVTLNIQFLKYMKEEFGMPFILSDRLWNILQKPGLYGLANSAEGYFYIPYPVLSDHICGWYDHMLRSNDIEIFGKVFGLKYPFHFLHTNGLISDFYYRQMEENIHMIEYEFLVNTRESLWQMKFIFDWPQIYPIDTNQAKLFSDTYRYYSDKSVNEKFSNYLNLWVIPDRIQDEIDTYNEEKIRSESDDYDEFDDWAGSDDWDPTQPIINTEPRIGRNNPCPCGSGKKYKKCCMDK
jgi:hypothetical protein